MNTPTTKWTSFYDTLLAHDTFRSQVLEEEKIITIKNSFFKVPYNVQTGSLTIEGKLSKIYLPTMGKIHFRFEKRISIGEFYL